MGFNDHQPEPKKAKKGASGGGGGLSSDWRGYINVDLTPQQKEQFDDWYHSGAGWETLHEAAAAGCVVTVKRDGAGSGFLGSVTQRTLGHANVGLSVTARSSEAWKALMRALFLVAVLGVESDWAAKAPPSDPDRW